MIHFPDFLFGNLYPHPSAISEHPFTELPFSVSKTPRLTHPSPHLYLELERLAFFVAISCLRNRRALSPGGLYTGTWATNWRKRKLRHRQISNSPKITQLVRDGTKIHTPKSIILSILLCCYSYFYSSNIFLNYDNFFHLSFALLKLSFFDKLISSIGIAGLEKKVQHLSISVLLGT